MTFEIYFNNSNTETDLSNYVVGDVNLQVRRDYAFANGSLNLIVDANVNANLTKNIPPFTFCRVNNKRFLCSSVCRHYMAQSKDSNNQPIQSYFHEVKLLDMMALCETFVLGAKTESNLVDIDSLEQIIELINNKYTDYNFILSPSVTSMLQNSHDYTFKAGTTFYDVLTEYGRKNHIRFYCVTLLYATNKWNFTLKAFDTNLFVYNEIDGVGQYDPNAPLSLSLEQNVDNYCNYLETVQNNVVDRNNETRFNDMTCRINAAAMNSDSAEILLPTNVESISTFIVNGTFSTLVSLQMPYVFTSQWMLDHGATQTGTSIILSTTYQNLIDIGVSYAGHDNLFQWLYDNNPILKELNIKNVYFQITRSGAPLYNNYSCTTATLASSWLNYTDYLLEETEWNTLDVYDKPKYAVYKSGGNRIYNLYGHYQYDFIHHIIGTSVGNYIEENANRSIYVNTLNYISIGVNTDSKPNNHTYTIKGIPMIDNFILKDTKTNTPLNETNWKGMTRTYENSANPVEFDALISDIEQQNRVLGTNEMSYEIELATIFDYLNIMVKDKSNVYWYVNSVIYTFKPNYSIATFNCSREPQKIADAIGVEYQFNPTKLPTENIVVRPLFYVNDYSTTYNKVKYNYDYGWDVFLLVRTTFENNSVKETLIRTTICQDANGNFFMYASMLDNYSAGKQSINISGTDNYQIVDVPYCDDNYRAESITLDLICMRQSLTNQFSEKLPNISLSDLSGMTYELSTIVASDLIYKDERETLAFTIRVNKPTN